MAEQELARGGEADDAAADNRDVVRHITTFSHLGEGPASTIVAVPRHASGNGGLDGGGEIPGHDQHTYAYASPFKNEAVKSFTDPADAAAMKAALAKRQGALGPALSPGHRRRTDRHRQSRSARSIQPGPRRSSVVIKFGVQRASACRGGGRNACLRNVEAQEPRRSALRSFLKLPRSCASAALNTMRC